MTGSSITPIFFIGDLVCTLVRLGGAVWMFHSWRKFRQRFYVFSASAWLLMAMWGVLRWVPSVAVQAGNEMVTQEISCVLALLGLWSSTRTVRFRTVVAIDDTSISLRLRMGSERICIDRGERGPAESDTIRPPSANHRE